MSLWTDSKEPTLQIPDGLPDLMKSFAKEAIKIQPKDLLQFGQEFFAKRRKEQLYQEQRPKLHVIISGAPAAGKGTQCGYIMKQFGLCHISVGDLLRAEVANETDIGKEAKHYMDNGDLVPDALVISLIIKRLAQPDVQENGWLLDGFPRTRAQADALEEACVTPHVYLLIQVPDDILVERISGRRLDPKTGDIYHLTFNPPSPEIWERLVQRTDDTEDKVKTRLLAYHEHLNAVLDKYKGKLVEVDGNRPLQHVWSDVQEALEQNQLQRCTESKLEAES